jgi:non-ribosomal peptide synthetase component F
MASPSEPTSCYFVANLGNLDSAVVVRLERWAEKSSAEHVIRRHADGLVTLYTSRAAAKTARQYQSLLRTLSSHWKMPFGKLESGWLSLLTEDEYRAVVGATNERTEAEVTVHSQCEVNRPHDQARLNAPQSQDEPRAGCMHRISLSDGFDERAQALYDSLRASRVLQPQDSVVCAA